MINKKKIVIIIATSLCVTVAFFIMALRICVSAAFTVEFRGETAVITQSPSIIYIAKSICPNSYLRKVFKGEGSINAGLLLVIKPSGSFFPSIIMSKDSNELKMAIAKELEGEDVPAAKAQSGR